MVETPNKKSLMAAFGHSWLPFVWIRVHSWFKMVRFGTKNSDRENCLPQHQQLTKTKMVRPVHPYHFPMPQKLPASRITLQNPTCSPKIQASRSQSNPVQHAFFNPEFWRFKLRTRTNAQEHRRTPESPRFEHQLTHVEAKPKSPSAPSRTQMGTLMNTDEHR
jgi:hypothetical protein